ncbi:hypothetical protein [Paraflavitalea sp. CAU 1676]|uniref:hypothetical protein n=1 Tax=Paraflavitalea sp. CAU 1676 TaxID=3032598 RepID=UPI0023DAD4B0|nr:hypothetical protein [Paraflavitalea sp. CAU 1676]MDF2191660.1 hypothetical protein [Paraflavitalea sp. CAU 1676]
MHKIRYLTGPISFIIYTTGVVILPLTSPAASATFGAHGSPQQKHAPLPIDKTHFDRWISLFSEITDELFEGEKATAAKEKAVKMSLLFQARLQLYQAQKENRP